MKEFISRRSLLAAAIASSVGTSLIATHLAVHAQTGPAAARTSTEGGVTVKTWPAALTDTGWEFSVVLDTHSQDLTDDLQQTAVLLLDGQQVQPLAWQGAGAGGHHREGVLKFPPPAQRPKTIELRISRPGESGPRVFRWDAAGLG